MRDILLVHSNEKLNALYKNRLLQHFRVNTAVDALSGIRQIKAKTPHLVISEYDLPWVSGLAVLKFVRRNLSTLATPVIFISHREPVLEALDYGANDWIKLNDTALDEIINRTFHHLITNKIII